jgi:hypothetical protein
MARPASLPVRSVSHIAVGWAGIIAIFSCWARGKQESLSPVAQSGALSDNGVEGDKRGVRVGIRLPY